MRTKIFKKSYDYIYNTKWYKRNKDKYFNRYKLSTHINNYSEFSKFMLFRHKITKKIKIVNTELIGNFYGMNILDYFKKDEKFYNYNNENNYKDLINIKELMAFKKDIFNELMYLLNYEYCPLTNIDESLFERFFEYVDMNDEYESIKDFMGCVSDFNAERICDEEYITLQKNNF